MWEMDGAQWWQRCGHGWLQKRHTILQWYADYIDRDFEFLTHYFNHAERC